MSVISIELPENVLLAAGGGREEFVREAKFLLATKLFELGRISAGKAAEISDMGKLEFLHATGRMGIPVADLDATEIAEELADD